MNLASPNNYASDTFGFLSTSWGQIILAIGSVAFVIIVKAFTHPSAERAFRLDDLAVGPDLLVLAVVTLVGYAASQFIAEKNANAISNFKAADVYGARQVNAGLLSALILLILFLMTALIQRVGQHSPKERVHDQNVKLCEVQRIKELLQEQEEQIGSLTADQLKDGDLQEKRITQLQERLQENLVKYLDTPRYKIVCGLIVPDLFGIFFLFIAVKSAVV